MSATPKQGDMFACQKCMAEIQVMKSCDCKDDCADFRCCGQPMENITEPTVRSADDQTVDDGFENDGEGKSEPTMAEQAEAAKKI